MRVTINFLSDLTGKDRRTVQKRLADMTPAADNTFNSAEALLAIYSPGGALDPQQEKAALDRARRELTELQKGEKERSLIPADAVLQHWSRLIGNARSRLLNLPGRLAIECSGKSQHEIGQIAKAVIHEALAELAASGLPNDDNNGEADNAA